MKIRYLPLALCASILLSCTAKKTEIKPSLSQQLAGEWQTVSFRVEMPPASGSGTLKVLDVNPQNWEEKMKLQPIRTFFNSNRVYSSEHRNLKGEVIFNPKGIWSLKGDTLIMMDTKPTKGKCCKYKIAIQGNEMELDIKDD